MIERNRSVSVVLSSGAAVVLLVVLCAQSKLPAAESPPAGESFDAVVAPFLAKHCADCHGADDPEADLSLVALEPAKLGGEDAVQWAKVVEVLKFGTMPPEDADQPTTEEIARTAGWIQSQLLAAGHELDVDHKLMQPAYANLLNHAKLFDGSQKGPAFSPSRLWRIHPDAYENILAGYGRLLGFGGPLSKPFTVGDGKGLVTNYAPLMQADSATLSQLMLNCRQIAQLQTVGFTRMEKDRRTKEMVETVHRSSPESFLAIMESDDPASDEQLAAAVAEEFQIVLSRKPTDSEATALAELLKQAIEIGGPQRGLCTMAMAVLLKPEAIYRMEVGLGPADEHGRRMLSPYELAYAIAYALTDSPPDQLMLGPEKNKRAGPPSLMDLARDGELSTRDDVRRVVTQIWEQERIEKPRILRFFREFFGYDAAETVFKGDRAGKEFAAKHLVQDADDLVLHIVKNDRDVLKELLTTDRYLVEWPGTLEDYERRIKYITDRIKPGNKQDRNYQYFVERTAKGLRPMPQANPTWRQTVRFYNLDPDTWDYPLEQPFAMPAGQRRGILTHPAWLAAWSGNFDNDPIRRGKWIREHLLADSVPDVPITVDASVPEDPHKTLRQRLEKTRDAYCWKCHQKMDPLGLPFEAYDDFGQHRTEEGLGQTRALRKPKTTAPVETAGQIIGSGDASIDGEVKDVHELMTRLADSPRVRQSFVRHAFRYWMGRNEMLSDSPTLISAERAYADEGGSFQALVISLITSDSFLYRK
jgi:mono/diheme cytochrome c family protein